MTAIFGFFQRDNQPIPPGLMQQAAQTLRHHAVDGSEIWQAEAVAFGQALTRFWKHSAASPRPEQDARRGLALVCDARLDNRLELAERLGIPTPDLREMSDSRLILHAYRIWEEECPKYLLGDFVFALWDARRKALFIARDPIGIRWLYYAASPRRFAFASDPAGLLDLMDESPRLDMITLDDYFSSSSNRLVSHTLFENVIKLPPAHALLVQADAIKIWPYWQAEQVPPLTIRDPREGAEHLGQLLKAAVSSRADTAGPVGSHLSGGLDSSAITALAVQASRQAARPDPLAFSWSPPFEMRPLVEKDERVYVQRVAEHLNLPFEYTYISPDVEALLETSDPSLLPQNTIRLEYALMENARKKGVRIHLSGWGGDEFAFSRGIGYPSGLIQRGRLLALARYFRHRFGWHPYDWLDGLYSHGIYPLLPAKFQTMLPLSLRRERDLRKRTLQRDLRQNQFNLPAPDFFQPDFYARLEQVHQPRFQWIPAGLHNCQKWYLIVLLKRVESWALWSARLGMRHAYPLLDQRVVEFSLAMPEDWVDWKGGTRRLALHAIADVLPASLFDGRDKQDRALASHQRTVEHQREVRKKCFEIFRIRSQSHPPVSRWVYFEYLSKILQEHPDMNDSGEVEALPRYGFGSVLKFAFIDSRTILEDQ